MKRIPVGWRLFGGAVLLFGAGIIGGVFITGMRAPVVVTAVRNPHTGFSLIDPTLYTESPEALSYPKYAPVKNAFTARIAAAEKTGKVTDVSVYFRDLNSGEWVGINHTDQFDPASLLKVITLMALLRRSEETPSILSSNINVPASVVIPTGTQDYFPPLNPVQSGNSYTVPVLATKLITQSDNGANALLIQFLGDSALATVFETLNVPVPGATTGVTAQQYSHLFRVLYNASYLSPADSEKALELLTQTTFTSGIVAGVPAGTTVAHKFGESTPALRSTDPSTHELHDCGIVYYPGHPYFLCVMTRGTDFPALAATIQDLSLSAWQQVSALKA